MNFLEDSKVPETKQDREECVLLLKRMFIPFSIIWAILLAVTFFNLK